MGNFPELVEGRDQRKITEYNKALVIDRIVSIDILQEFEIRDLALLKQLVEMILEKPGLIINYDKLSSTLGRSRVTVTTFVWYLEYSSLIRLIGNYRGN